ncbi:hypothetical protein EQV77_04085 [Halobacillus fulvus]|nr:hypothetical protein EQV77_04085 [Halobacillus fulvus]
MSKTARWMMFIFMFFILFQFSVAAAQAAPTAFECLENPDLADCPSSATSDNEEGSTLSDGEASDEPSMAWMITRLIFVLGLVLALIYGLLKFFNKKNKWMNRNRTMENLGGMTLAPNRSIQAVRIGEQVFILGVGDTVQKVTEITDEKTKQSLIEREETGTAATEWLDRFKRSDQEGSGSSAVQFQQLFEKQLQEMKKNTKRLRGKQEGDQRHE